jgi:hypothetical protein
MDRAGTCDWDSIYNWKWMKWLVWNRWMKLNIEMKLDDSINIMIMEKTWALIWNNWSLPQGWNFMTWMMLGSWMKWSHECNKSQGWNYVNMPITKTFPPFLLPFCPSPPIFPISQPHISSLLLGQPRLPFPFESDPWWCPFQNLKSDHMDEP